MVIPSSIMKVVLLTLLILSAVYMKPNLCPAYENPRALPEQSWIETGYITGFWRQRVTEIHIDASDIESFDRVLGLSLRGFFIYLNTFFQSELGVTLPGDYQIFDPNVIDDPLALTRTVSDLIANPGAIAYFTNEGDFDVTVIEVSKIPGNPDLRYSWFMIGHWRDGLRIPVVFPFCILPMGKVEDGFRIIRRGNDSYAFDVSSSARGVEVGETVNITTELLDPQMNPRVGEPIILQIEDSSGRLRKITPTPIDTDNEGKVYYQWEVDSTPGLVRIEAVWIYKDSRIERSNCGTRITVSEALPPDLAVIDLTASKKDALPGDAIKVTTTISAGGMDLPKVVTVDFLAGTDLQEQKTITVREHGGEAEFDWDVEPGLSLLEVRVTGPPDEEVTDNNSLSLPYIAEVGQATSTLRIFAASGMTSDRIADASVKVDGNFVGFTSPLDDILYDVTPGKHLVEVTADGFYPQEKFVYPEPGEEKRVDMSMSSTLSAGAIFAPSYPNEANRITLTSVSQGAIQNYRWYVDEILVGTTFNVTLDPLAAGVHEARLEIEDSYGGTDAKSVEIPVMSLVLKFEVPDSIDNDGDGKIDEGFAREDSMPVLAPGEQREMGGYLDDYEELEKDGNWHRFSTLDNEPRPRSSLGETMTVKLVDLGVSSVADIDSMWLTFESMYGSGDSGTQPDPVSIWVDASEIGREPGRILYRWAMKGNAFVQTDSWGGWKGSSVNVPLWAVESDLQFTVNVAQKNRDGSDYTKALIRNIQLHVRYPENLSEVRTEIDINGETANTSVSLDVNNIVVLVENGEWSHPSFETGESVVLEILVPEGLELEPGEIKEKTVTAGETDLVTFRLQDVVLLSYELQVRLMDEEGNLIKREADLRVNGGLHPIKDGIWGNSYPNETSITLHLDPPSDYKIADPDTTITLESDEIVDFVLSEEIHCDFNDDGIVWLEDFSIFAGAFGSADGSSNWMPICDLNEDGTVWLDDFSIFAASFGKSAFSQKTVAKAIVSRSDANLSLKIDSQINSHTGEFCLRVCLDGLRDIEGYLLNLTYDSEKMEFLRAERPARGIYGEKDRALPLLGINSFGNLTVADVLGNDNPVYGSNAVIDLYFRGKDSLSEDSFKLVEMVVLDKNDQLFSINQWDMSLLPQDFALLPNYPNPFNEVTAVSYDLPRTSPVKLKVYNMLGQEVAVLDDEVKPGGRYQVIWDASRMASGVYLIYLEAGDFAEVRKAVLLR